jgi:hypothetical protein
LNIDLYKMSAYTTLPITALQNTTKYHMDDEVKNYKEGDVIYYSGKCHEFSDFYAKIDNITKCGMDLTVLELEYEGDKVHFYETDSQRKGLTRRPFYLLVSNP